MFTGTSKCYKHLAARETCQGVSADMFSKRTFDKSCRGPSPSLEAGGLLDELALVEESCSESDSK